MSKHWILSEILFLKANYPSMGKEWCSEKIGRSNSSVRAKASELKLKQDRNSKFFKDWQRRAQESKVGKKRPEHSVFMKKLLRERMDLPFSARPRTKKEKKIIGTRAKKWYAENEHPRGMLGKVHTETTKEGLSLSTKKMWNDPSSYVNTKKYRQLLSDRVSRSHSMGPPRIIYSRGNSGHYDINGVDYFFRSSWEANYALYLNFLIKRGEISRWEYEADTFWFEKIKRGVRSYKPDFKIFGIDGSVEYHEVKGWMDKKSITKTRRMKRYHPSVKLLIIDKECYMSIKNKIGKMLKFY